MTPRLGCNAPCACGRKFKHSCLSKQRATTGACTAQERQDALAKLLRFTECDEFAEDFRLGQMLIWGGGLDLVPETRRQELEADEQSFLPFLDWYLFALALREDHDTLAAWFLASRGAALSPGERTCLELMRGSCLRLCEVVEVRPDEGLGLEGPDPRQLS